MNFIKTFFGTDNHNHKVLKSYENDLLSHTITGYLGSGSIGKVYKVRHKDSLEEFALKVMEFDDREKMYTLSMAEREVTSLQELNHPNILRFYTAGVLKRWPTNMTITENNNIPQPGQSKGIIFIKTELCNSSLKHKLGSVPDKGVFLQEMKSYALQLANALCYIHNVAKIMHRDINPSNILLQGGIAKIADLGQSRFIPGYGNTNSNSLTTGYLRGWLNFQSPEQVKGDKYTELCDVYSLGVTFFEMFHPTAVADRENFQLLSLYDSEHICAKSDVLSQIPESKLRILLAGMLSDVGTRPNADGVYRQLLEIVN